MKAGKFIEKYLSQCEDTVICLHAPDNCSSSMFSIYEWQHEWKKTPMVSEIVYEHLQCEVSQIIARVEKFNKGLDVVIHIYTEYPYEEAK